MDTARRPLAWTAGYFALGLALGLEPRVPACWLLLILGAGLWGRLLRSGCMTRRLAVVLIAALVLGAGYGVWRTRQNVSGITRVGGAPAASLDGQSLAVDGTIVSPVQVDGNRAQFKLRLRKLRWQNGGTSAAVQETVLMQVKLLKRQEQAVASAWTEGESVRAAGALKLPSQARNFGAFDYRAYLDRQRIHWIVAVNGTDSVRISQARPGRLAAAGWLDHWRGMLAGEIGRLYPSPQDGLMNSLLLGLKQDLDGHVYRAFTRLGIGHVLAISGLHVAVVLSAWMGLLTKLRIRREWVTGSAALLLPVFICMTGASPSVIRAGVTAGIGLYAVRSGRLQDGLNALGAAALALLLFNPDYLLNVSFQLSFLITLGLLLALPALQRRIGSGRLRHVRSALIVTVTAQLLSLPLSVYYFQQISLLSLPANLLLVPIISLVVLPFGYLSLFTDPLLHAIGVPIGLADGLSYLNAYLIRLVEGLDSFQRLQLLWPKAPIIWVVAYYVAFGLASVCLLRCTVQTEAKKDARVAELNSHYMETTLPLGGLTEDLMRTMPQLDGPPDDLTVTTPLGGRTADLAQMPFNGPIPGTAETPSRRSGQAPPASGLAMQQRANPATSGHFNPAPLPVQLTPLLPRRRFAFGRGAALLIPMLWLALILFAYLGYGPDARTWWPIRLDPGPKPADIDVLDVGQGDAIFIRLPNGRTMLVDGGGTLSFYSAAAAWMKRKNPFEVGREVVVPELTTIGVHELDDVISSHEDLDHLDGLGAVFRRIPVKHFWFNGTLKESASAEKVLNEVVRMGVPTYKAEAGKILPLGPHAELQFLYPVLQPNGILLDNLQAQNSHCVVFVLRVYGHTMLFTGDMDAASERQVLKEVQAWPADKRIWRDGIDVLKVAHHGSKTATTEAWLNYWHPKQAVISVGAHNRYGHPSPEVVDRLGRHGIGIYRTDRNGEVELRITPNGMSFRTYLGGGAGD